MKNRVAFLLSLWITLLKMSILAKPQFFGKKLPSVSLGGVRFGGGGGGRPGGKPGEHPILFSSDPILISFPACSIQLEREEGTWHQDRQGQCPSTAIPPQRCTFEW